MSYRQHIPVVPHSLPCFWIPASLDYLLFDSHQQHGCFATFLLLKVSHLVWLSVRLLYSFYLIVRLGKKRFSLCLSSVIITNMLRIEEVSLRRPTASDCWLHWDQMHWYLRAASGESTANTAISWPSSTCTTASLINISGVELWSIFLISL